MCYRLGDLANDGALKARGLAMLRARANFRFPTIDSSGYFVMQGAEPVGARNDMQMPGHIAYLARASVDTGWGGWHDLLAVSQVNPASNPDIVGWEKQFFTDGQYLPEASGANTSAVDSPYFPDRYAAAKTVATASAVYNLPMTAGQPDFGWVDEENMVLAAKHGSGTGEERFFADLAWRSADSITGLVKIFSLTSITARIAEVMSDDVQFRPSGQQVFGSSQVEANSSRQPPDNPVSAYGGVPYLTALRDDLSAVPSTNRDAGRAWGYTLRFGHWLAGINGHHSQSYTLKAPSDFTTGTDLVSGTIKAVPVAQPSKSSTVFYLTGTAGANDKPAAPLYFNGIGGTAQVVLTWSAAAGATSYLVERATASGGPFTQVANGITGLTCADMSGIVAGKIYYYRVTGVNGAGSGSPSPQIQAQAGPPSPWTAADIGTVATPGLTGFENGGFTVVGSGGDIGSSADSFQYAYVPLTGDGTITARVANISGSTATSKVGVMMRESLAAGSKHAALTLQNGGGTLKLISRSGTDGGTALGTVYISGVPSWLRLTRTGSVFISSFSTDGKSWTVGDAVTIPMNTAITAGLAVCARTTALNYTNFDHVNAPGWATPLAPSALVASLKNTDVNLAWNPAAGATGYNVKRSTTSGRSYATIASGLTGSTYTDFGLLGSGSGITYDYVVSALNAQGESVDSVESAASVVVPPDAPTSVTITGGNLQAILGWIASDGATSYSIYRSTASGGPYALVKSGVTGTGYVDTGLSSVANTPYFYVVTTSNANGEGIYSTEMEFINSAVTVTGFGIYSGEITLGQSGALTLDDSSGAYASSVTRGPDCSSLAAWALPATPPMPPTRTATGGAICSNTPRGPIPTWPTQILPQPWAPIPMELGSRSLSIVELTRR